MPYTIDEFARTTAETWDADLNSVREDITAWVGQISDDPDLWDAEAQMITDEGEQVISAQVNATYCSPSASETMRELRDAVAAADAAHAAANEADLRRDAAIRAAIKASQPIQLIADTSDMSRSRVYQIRDGRR